MDKIQLTELMARVQHNCHISDARHGADYGLCTYLLKMREYFRWEKGLGYADQLEKEAVGDWLTQREALWGELENEAFSSVQIARKRLDPFDNEGINALLNPLGLAYSGGLGRSGKPHFFLGELLHQEQGEGYAVMVSGRELARDLASPPAMSLGNRVYIRKESMGRMLWEKLESWRWSRLDNAMGRAFSCYPFETDLDGSLNAMTEHELDLLLLHERGECIAGELLGDEWNEMLLDLVHTPAELAARAVRDHIADCSVTLPALADSNNKASIHFFIGNLSAMRKSLFPELLSVYNRWLDSGEVSEITALAGRGEVYWKSVAHKMLALHAEFGNKAAGPIRELAETSHL